MAINRIPQKQIKSDYSTFVTLEEQMAKVEDRTRVQAKLIYDSKTQWDQGTVTDIDTTTTLDQIQLDKVNGEYFLEGEYISYVIDLGAINVSIETLTHVQNKPAGTSVSYYTRTGDVESPDGTWSEWQTINIEDMVQSPNSRYVQFKIVLATTDVLKTPKVSSVTLLIWASAGLQELFEARGGYKTLSERLLNMDSVFVVKTLTTEGMFEVELGMIIDNTDKLLVYYNGALQNEGTGQEDTYVVVPSATGATVQFIDGVLEENGVVTCRIGGNGSSVIKEYIVIREAAAGVYDGVNRVFTLVHTPVLYNSQIFYYGILLEEGSDADYILTGNTITMNYPPDADSVLKATYKFSL